MNISLETTPKPKVSNIRQRQSKLKGKSALTLKKRIEIEETFFKINFYFGGTLDTEIEKVIPRLIDQFKEKDDMDMSMEGMEDMMGMVRLTRTSTLNI